MIEVEKKFSLEGLDLEEVLKDFEFLGEVVNHDIYYDYPDYRLLKNDIAFRNRNGNFELKIKKGSGIYEEIEDKDKIRKYFKTDSLENFIVNEVEVMIDFKNTRQKYKKDDFNLDIDETDFGYKVGEIEVMVGKEEEVKNAEDKIKEFALKNNLELGKGLSKKRAYCKKFNIEL